MSEGAPKCLDQIYRNYVQAILHHDLDVMDEYVSEKVVHNGRHVGLQGYKDLLRTITSTGVNIEIKRLITDEHHVAAALIFSASESTKELAGVQLDGTAFSYLENAIYDFEDGKIVKVHAVLDIDALRAHERQA